MTLLKKISLVSISLYVAFLIYACAAPPPSRVDSLQKKKDSLESQGQKVPPAVETTDTKPEAAEPTIQTGDMTSETGDVATQTPVLAPTPTPMPDPAPSPAPNLALKYNDVKKKIYDPNCTACHADKGK